MCRYAFYRIHCVQNALIYLQRIQFCVLNVISCRDTVLILYFVVGNTNARDKTVTSLTSPLLPLDLHCSRLNYSLNTCKNEKPVPVVRHYLQ